MNKNHLFCLLVICLLAACNNPDQSSDVHGPKELQDPDSAGKCPPDCPEVGTLDSPYLKKTISDVSMKENNE